MAPVEGQPSVFSVIVHLPPGYVVTELLQCASIGTRCNAHHRYHQYKFIVDGEWRHDETQPYMPDPLGNVNNWLFVRRADSTTTPSTYVCCSWLYVYSYRALIICAYTIPPFFNSTLRPPVIIPIIKQATPCDP